MKIFQKTLERAQECCRRPSVAAALGAWLTWQNLGYAAFAVVANAVINHRNQESQPAPTTEEP